jgi:hypothetical protein
MLSSLQLTFGKWDPLAFEYRNESPSAAVAFFRNVPNAVSPPRLCLLYQAFETKMISSSILLYPVSIVGGNLTGQSVDLQ